ncbi:probable vacuolar protein sorting-associated protein VTA1 homolog at N-terminal half [Coccomyxa sp. Obi]|nr:probable vacuolar protein sorting-associated protein VTA1 homolog at N-terminal half [Coccomyxa sp. Obi]
MGSTEEQKKAILPFLQRADEVTKIEPKVAYYCRMYAVEQGLALENRSPQIEGVLGALLAKLEKDKPFINSGPDDQQYCENFAVKVFNRADKVDRAGRADKSTATTYYAASVFIEILRQWGELSPDLVDMQRYAAWKAADIRKALREGRPPTAGPPADSADAKADADLKAEADLLDDLGLPAVPGSLSAPPAPHATGSSSGAQASAGAPPTPPAGPPAAPPPAFPRPPSAPASIGGAPRFQPGSKVIYSATGQGAGVKGTVARVTREGPEGCQYMVALSQQIVEADEAHLAPEFEPGQRVVYHAPDGSLMDASVSELNASHWRPTYVISCDADGEQREVMDVHLERLKEPRSPLMPDSSPPSIAAIPPPADGGSPGSAAAPPSPPPVGARPPPQAPFAASRPPPTPGPPPAQSLPMPPPPAVSQGPTATAGIPVPTAGFKPSLAAITEAHKLAKYGASSLGFEDVPSAVKYLTDALKLLTQSQ